MGRRAACACAQCRYIVYVRYHSMIIYNIIILQPVRARKATSYTNTKVETLLFTVKKVPSRT